MKLKDYIKVGEVVAFVNFSVSFQKLKNNSKISYVTDYQMKQNMNVRKYLEKNIPNFSMQKFEDACKMVLLSSKVIGYNLKDLSRTEMKQLSLVEALLWNASTIVFQNFEEGFYEKNRNYYQKLFLKLTKYGKCIMIITNDVSFLFGLTTRFFLFTEDSSCLITNFYDDRIYQYVKMPTVISYVKFLNKKNISMDPYIESKEVLKAIYRSVNSRDSL